MTDYEWVALDGGAYGYERGTVRAIACPASSGAGWFWWRIADGRAIARGEADTGEGAKRNAGPIIAHALGTG